VFKVIYKLLPSGLSICSPSVLYNLCETSFKFEIKKLHFACFIEYFQAHWRCNAAVDDDDDDVDQDDDIK